MRPECPDVARGAVVFDPLGPDRAGGSEDGASVVDQLDFWPRVAEARRRLADQLEGWGPDVWDRLSMCVGWSVRDVVAHLVSMATVTKTHALWSYLRAGVSLDDSSRSLMAALLADRSDDQLLELLRSSADAHHTPPGLRPEGVLAELVVHVADITVAIDEPSAIPDDDLVVTLAYLARRVPKNTRFNLTRHGRAPVLDGAQLVDGLQLRATDVPWRHGEAGAPLVEGPADMLVLAIAGREVGDRLSGPGVARLVAVSREVGSSPDPGSSLP